MKSKTDHEPFLQLSKKKHVRVDVQPKDNQDTVYFYHGIVRPFQTGTHEVRLDAPPTYDITINIADLTRDELENILSHLGEQLQESWR